ncbi:helix-turn-helix transcriptional regulator [Arhodomonas sp. AD133]|uniref:helix-turn-helix transcriptional regulator n=1 Tax=Arhodomonas sp. AD133 TaxID=3415009 RepID=UPI003EBAF307
MTLSHQRYHYRIPSEGAACGKEKGWQAPGTITTRYRFPTFLLPPDGYPTLSERWSDIAVSSIKITKTTERPMAPTTYQPGPWSDPSGNDRDEHSIPDYESIERGLHDRIGANLRLVRSQLGLSQAFLAAMLRVSHSQYRRYEKGHDLPRLHTAILWSVETGIPTHWLFSGTGYHAQVGATLRPAWVPVLHFVNTASPAALRSFQAALEGMVNASPRPPLATYTSPDLDECRRHIDERYYQVIARQLRKFRREHTISQDTIARRMGISTAAYKRYERPGRHIYFSINLIMRFWAATGVSPLELTRGTVVFRYREQQNRNFDILIF